MNNKKNKDAPFLNYDGRDAGREFRNWLNENSTTFKGINFEGSGVTAITDILGQYLMQDAFIANVSYNESSVIRSKIWANKASAASAKGYTPHKKVGSRISCNILLDSDGPVTLSKRNSIFVGHKNNNTYPFVALSNKNSTKYSETQQIMNDVELVQGTWENFSYKVTDPGFSRFTIEDDYIDISTINVYVYESKTSKVGTKYKRVKHISDIYMSSYLLVLNSENKYSIVFGDDKLGNRPTTGSLIYVEYVKTVGSDSNDISKITIPTKINDKTVNSITSNYTSFGGSDRDSMQSIEMNSMMNSSFIDAKTYYFNLLKTEFPQLNDIIVIPGEEMDQKRYGVTYIYATIGNQALLPALKEKMIQMLEQYKINPCIFIINDPEFVSIDLLLNFEYLETYLKGKEEIRNEIEDIIADYSSEHYGKISSSFYPSELTHYILSNIDDIKLIDTMYTYTIKLPYSNPGINATYSVEVPKNVNVSKITFRNYVLDVKKGQFRNVIEFHPSSNTITFDGLTRTENDFVLIESDDDASYITNNSHWVPVIKNTNIVFNEGQ